MSFLRNTVERAAAAKKVLLDHFTYSTTWAPLAALGNVTNTIPISADSDFLWMETVLVDFTGANVLNPVPDLLISFQDTGAGRNLQDNPLHVNLVTGNGQWPFVLPEPKLLIGNGALQVNLINNVNQQEARVHLHLIGYKIFYITAYNRNQLMAGF